jgi:hypothetical protein
MMARIQFDRFRCSYIALFLPITPCLAARVAKADVRHSTHLTSTPSPLVPPTPTQPGGQRRRHARQATPTKQTLHPALLCQHSPVPPASAEHVHPIPLLGHWRLRDHAGAPAREREEEDVGLDGRADQRYVSGGEGDDDAWRVEMAEARVGRLVGTRVWLRPLLL